MILITFTNFTRIFMKSNSKKLKGNSSTLTQYKDILQHFFNCDESYRYVAFQKCGGDQKEVREKKVP